MANLYLVIVALLAVGGVRGQGKIIRRPHQQQVQGNYYQGGREAFVPSPQFEAPHQHQQQQQQQQIQHQQEPPLRFVPTYSQSEGQHHRPQEIHPQPIHNAPPNFPDPPRKQIIHAPDHYSPRPQNYPEPPRKPAVTTHLQEPPRKQIQQQQQQTHETYAPEIRVQFQPKETTHRPLNYRKDFITPIPIIKLDKQQSIDGSYKSSYETGNNIIAEETGFLKNPGIEDEEALVQHGSYSYTDPDGNLISVRYTADEHGFRAEGDHFPTPPPIPPEIQKGLDLIYETIRLDAEKAAQEQRFQSTRQESQNYPNYSGYNEHHADRRFQNQAQEEPQQQHQQERHH